jgi:hypothetical protein
MGSQSRQLHVESASGVTVLVVLDEKGIVVLMTMSEKEG